MMRTLKQKIKSWKILAASAILPIFFFVVACQDQAEETQATVIEETIQYPSNVQAALNKLKQENPHDQFVVLPPHGKIEDVDFENDETISEGTITRKIDAMTIIKTNKVDSNGDPLKYIILQYKNSAQKDQTVIKEIEVPKANTVFLVTEVPPTYQGGNEKMGAFISKNLRYPQKAKNENIEGSVFVSFVIETDGTVKEAKVLKGIDPACDMEALRIVKSFPAWNPGKQNGKAVRTQFVAPVKFKL